jgi:hypothetical protein
LFFFLDKKERKNQDCARFAQKTTVSWLKTFKLNFLLRKKSQTEKFFTPSSLVFWLTGQGRRAGNSAFAGI